MDSQSKVAVSLAVLVALYSSFYLYLNSFKEGVHIETKKGCIPSNLPQFTTSCLKYRLHLLLSSLKRFIVDRPNRGIEKAIEKQEELSKSISSTSTSSRKVIYFIRHGQSIWNMTFNYHSNIILILIRVVRLFLIETFISPTNDTCLYDSPLSMTGINQALEMSKNICETEDPISDDLKVLSSNSGQTSVLFTSNLRRAQSTMLLALQDRLRLNNEKIEVCNELEELVPHPDCVSLSSTFQESTVPSLEVIIVPDKAKNYSRYLNYRIGTDVTKMAAYERMLAFNDLVFKRQESHIIICGHSRWIRSYLKCFLPKASNDHEFSRNKIGNLDTLRFELIRQECSGGQAYYSVEPNSVKLVYKNTK